MKNIFRKVSAMLLIIILLILAACGKGSDDCQVCGAASAKAYKNEWTSETEYVCSDCASKCTFCGAHAERAVSAVMGGIKFVCDGCGDKYGF